MLLTGTGLTAYDVQKITRGDYAAFTGSKEKASVLAALATLAPEQRFLERRMGEVRG